LKRSYCRIAGVVRGSRPGFVRGSESLPAAQDGLEVVLIAADCTSSVKP
jgi:hypothetical protein